MAAEKPTPPASSPTPGQYGALHAGLSELLSQSLGTTMALAEAQRRKSLTVPEKKPFETPPFEDGAPTSYKLYKRGDNPAWWITEPYPIKMPEHLRPAAPTPKGMDEAWPNQARMDLARRAGSVALDAEAVLAQDTLPSWRVLPFFAGRRYDRTQRRINRIQSRIERWADSDDVIRYAGESIIRGIQGASYHTAEDKLRPSGQVGRVKPTGHVERTLTRALTAVAGDRHTRRGIQALVGESYHGDHHPHAGEMRPPAAIDFSRGGEYRSMWQQHIDHRNNRFYDKVQRQIDRRERLFTRLSSIPSRYNQHLINKRNKLVRKSQVLAEHEERNRAIKPAAQLAGTIMRDAAVGRAGEIWDDSKGTIRQHRAAHRLARQALKAEAVAQVSPLWEDQKEANRKMAHQVKTTAGAAKTKVKKGFEYMRGNEQPRQAVRDRKYHALWGSDKGPEDKPQS